MTSSDDATFADDSATPDSTTGAPASMIDENGLVLPVEGRELSPLEQAIRVGQTGEGDMNEVIGQFVNSLVVVPTATEVNEDLNEMQPVLFDRDGTPMLAAFTNVDRIANSVIEVAQFAVQIPAAELVQAIPENTGLVINPGNHEGFEMLPEGVAQLANDVRGMLASMQDQQSIQSAMEPPVKAEAPQTKISPSQIPNF